MSHSRFLLLGNGTGGKIIQDTNWFRIYHRFAHKPPIRGCYETPEDELCSSLDTEASFSASQPILNPSTMASENRPSAREAAQSFISNLASRQFAALGDLFAADGTYWVSGEQPKVPWAGSIPASERLPQLPAMHGNFTTFSIDQKAFVAEGQRAVVELSVHGIDSAGGRYDNDVVMIFEVNEDGKIVALREYLDNMQPLAYYASKGSSEEGVLGLDSKTS